MSAGIRQIVEAQIEAYNSRNGPQFAGFYTVDGKLGTIGELPKHCGRLQIQAHFTKLFEQHPHIRCEASFLTEIGPYALYRESVSGVGPRSIRVIAIYEVRGDHIASVWFLEEG